MVIKYQNHCLSIILVVEDEVAWCKSNVKFKKLFTGKNL